MARERLQDATEELKEAAALTNTERRKRLLDQADQLGTLATGDRDPDHGRLDRHMNVLAELANAADGTASEHISEARQLVSEYRETVEGV